MLNWFQHLKFLDPEIVDSKKVNKFSMTVLKAKLKLLYLIQ